MVFIHSGESTNRRMGRFGLCAALVAPGVALAPALEAEVEAADGGPGANLGLTAPNTPVAAALAELVDFNGDGRSDLALTGTSGWVTVPVALSAGDGTFTVTNEGVGDFAAWAATGARVLSGDFDGDGRTDIALTGTSGWSTVPVAFARGGGRFDITNGSVGAFASWAATGARVISGDFNRDGRTDLALTGTNGWSTLPVAFSRGDGTFDIRNQAVGDFAAWAATGATVVPGDFNRDGRMDLALTGTHDWSTVPIAFSRGNGGFDITNQAIGDFAAWAATDARVIPGDFNRDGRTDIALVGGNGWSTVPVAFSRGNGAFDITNSAVGDFAAWAATGAEVVPGDFNGDGRTDIALTGTSGWNTVPVAFSRGDGTFDVANTGVGDFAAWAATGAEVVPGDFNGDGRTDIALTGTQGWSTLPVAFSTGTGFSVTNRPIADFATWSTAPGVKVIGALR
ncbi:FG-GAP repeat domain-containing protein [Nannocystis pusilla]|uniref:FG-GAP repeat domain-containing protein n=1 Tax=Nannocystis pusilla TaxID=889268 RepID=UPI003BEFBDD3